MTVIRTTFRLISNVQTCNLAKSEKWQFVLTPMKPTESEKFSESKLYMTLIKVVSVFISYLENYDSHTKMRGQKSSGAVLEMIAITIPTLRTEGVMQKSWKYSSPLIISYSECNRLHIFHNKTFQFCGCLFHNKRLLKTARVRVVILSNQHISR